MVSRVDAGVETFSPQSFIPAQEGDTCVTGVLVLHIWRGAGCWVREGYRHFHYIKPLRNIISIQDNVKLRARQG